MMKLGRNDPCHCGSGKKYKKCHIDAADQRNLAGVEQVEQSSANSELRRASVDVKNLPNLFRRLSETGSAKQREEIRELAAKTKPIIEYLEREEQIEAAGAELGIGRAAGRGRG